MLQLNGQTYISWETGKEVNNAFFAIERSSDGIHFNSIGTVKSQLNNPRYSFVDYSPLIGTNYYRIRQTDIDGQSKTFTIKTVRLNAKGQLLSTPNPAKGELTVFKQQQMNIPVVYTIYDMMGRIHQTGKITSYPETIGLNQLKGYFILKLNSGEAARFFVK